MALLDPAAGLRAVLEDDDLVAAVLAEDLGADAGLATTGRPIVAVSPSATSRTRSSVTVSPALTSSISTSSCGADLDAILLPAGLDDCVHGSSVARPRRARVGRPRSGDRVKHRGCVEARRGMVPAQRSTSVNPRPRSARSVRGHRARRARRSSGDAPGRRIAASARVTVFSASGDATALRSGADGPSWAEPEPDLGRWPRRSPFGWRAWSGRGRAVGGRSRPPAPPLERRRGSVVAAISSPAATARSSALAPPTTIRSRPRPAGRRATARRARRRRGRRPGRRADGPLEPIAQVGPGQPLGQDEIGELAPRARHRAGRVRQRSAVVGSICLRPRRAGRPAAARAAVHCPASSAGWRARPPPIERRRSASAGEARERVLRNARPRLLV